MGAGVRVRSPRVVLRLQNQFRYVSILNISWHCDSIRFVKYILYYDTSSGAILQSGGPASDEVSLEVALERVRKIREENKAEDSDAESGTDELDLITEKIIGKVVSTQGSRQLMKVSEVGTDYYHNREYKGLDPKVSTEKLPDTAVVVGQSGLPVSYKYNT